MRNFKVHNIDGQYKMTTHQYRLTVVGATRISTVNITGMPTNLFRFKDFSEIQNGNYVPDLLIGNIWPILG
jgi:hypothetical protein